MNEKELREEIEWQGKLLKNEQKAVFNRLLLIKGLEKELTYFNPRPKIEDLSVPELAIMLKRDDPEIKRDTYDDQFSGGLYPKPDDDDDLRPR